MISRAPISRQLINRTDTGLQPTLAGPQALLLRRAFDGGVHARLLDVSTCALPWLNQPWHWSKQRMALRDTYGAPPSVQRPTPRGQLSQQMLPLVRYLRSGDRNRVDHTQRSDLAFIEGITAQCRLRMDSRKIRTYGATRKRMCPKSVQLRMAPISLCLSTQYRPCQQRFAPQRNQALRIEVLRVDCPESHIARWRLTTK